MNLADINKEKIKEDVGSFVIRNPIILRYLSYLLSSVLLSLLPILFFIAFMSEVGFFSYDFFVQGLFGMKTFFLFSVFILIIYSVFMYSFLFPFIKLIYLRNCEKVNKIDNGNNSDTLKEKETIRYRKTSLIYLLINVVFSIGVFDVFLNEGRLDLYFSLLILCFFIAIHLGVLLFGIIKHQFITLTLLTIVFMSFLLFNSKNAADIVGLGLKNFGVGGEVPVTIYLKNPKSKDITNEDKLKATLILLSPIHLYYKLNDAPSIGIMDRDKIFTIELIKNKQKQK